MVWKTGGGGGIDEKLLLEGLQRAENCFSVSNNKRYYSSNGEIKYSLMHSVQSAILLYYLSNTAYRDTNYCLANELYYLNKIMHGVDWFYEIELPDVFGAEHPVGSVVGRARYGEYLFLHQNTTIGSSIKKYPEIGNNVVLCANSSVLGNCRIGQNVIISSGTTLVNKDIPDNCIVFSDGKVRIYEIEEIVKKISILTDFKPG